MYKLNQGDYLLAALQKIFQQPNIKSEQRTLNNELMLLCGIMMEAASIDGIVDKNEILKIKTSLVTIFHEKSEEVNKAISSCLEQTNEPNSLHFFTSKINKSFDNNKKIVLIETLWEIILVDKKIHDFESNFIRRLAGLMYISDVSCGKAKRRIVTKLEKIENNL